MPKKLLLTLEKAIEYALMSRMELKQRQINIDKSLFEMERTKSMNEFRADLQLTLGIFGDNEDFGKVYNTPTSNPSVGLSLNIPIWDWGERNARIQAQEVSNEKPKTGTQRRQKNKSEWISADHIAVSKPRCLESKLQERM